MKRSINRLKQPLSILLLFLLLFAAASVPVFFTKYCSRYYLNKTTLFAVQEEDLADSVQSRDLWERLKILKRDAFVQNQRVAGTKAVVVEPAGRQAEVTESSQVTMATAEEEEKEHEQEAAMQEELTKRAKKQLRRLQSCRALPEISFSDLGNVSISKRIYMEVENPACTFSVWEIYMDYPSAFVCLYMDTETSALFEVFMVSKKEDFTYQKEKGIPRAFLEYLNTFSKVPGDSAGRAERFFGQALCTGSKFCLYAASADQRGENMVSYRFEPLY